MVHVVIYSDQPILAAGLESLIADDPVLKLNACCSNISMLKEHLANRNADLAVVDLTPQITSTTLKQIQSLAPHCKIILWTSSLAPDFALQALTIGVRGVLRKTLPLEAHRQCLHRVHAGGLWFEKSLTDSFRFTKRVALSPRESQLVTLLSRGLKNKEISAELGISEGTVKVYLSHLFQKSGARDRFDLALQGLKNFSLAGMSTEGRSSLRSMLMDETICRR
jgi:two-component system nitrate/nitrite response regulator NarL